MAYTFGFTNPAYDDYDDLWTDDEVREAVMEECSKAVADMGSDAYEPDFGGPYDDEWFDGLSEDRQYELTAAAHELGIQNVAERETSRIMSDFRDVLAGRYNEAESKLIDGTSVFLSEQ